jgi:hypothetical protein
MLLFLMRLKGVKNYFLIIDERVLLNMIVLYKIYY